MKTFHCRHLLGALAAALCIGTAPGNGQVVRKSVTAGGAIILPDRPAQTAELELLEREARLRSEVARLRLEAAILQIEQPAHPASMPISAAEARLRKEIEKFQAEQREQIRAAARRAIVNEAAAVAAAERMAAVVRPVPRVRMALQNNNIQIYFETVPIPEIKDPANAPFEFAEDVPPPGESNRLVIAPQSLDALLFGPNLNAKSARAQLEQRLADRIKLVDRDCKLTPEQTRKLELAGRGDIHRHFERADEIRTTLRQIHLDIGNRAIQVAPVFAAIEPAHVLRESVKGAGLFGESSLFAKTLRKVLTADQAAEYDLRRLQSIPERRLR